MVQPRAQHGCEPEPSRRSQCSAFRWCYTLTRTCAAASPRPTSTSPKHLRSFGSGSPSVQSWASRRFDSALRTAVKLRWAIRRDCRMTRWAFLSRFHLRLPWALIQCSGGRRLLMATQPRGASASKCSVKLSRRRRRIPWRDPVQATHWYMATARRRRYQA